MKEINSVKITQIATFLQGLPGNNVVNGESGIAFVKAKTMKEFGTTLLEIVLEEMENKSGEIKKTEKPK